MLFTALHARTPEDGARVGSASALVVGSQGGVASVVVVVVFPVAELHVGLGQ